MAALRLTAFAQDSKEPKTPLEIGKPVPELLAYNAGGEALYEDQYEGRYVLVVFWSPRSEMREPHIPVLAKLRQTYKDQENFLMLSISVDRDWDRWLKFQNGQGEVSYGEARGRFPFYSDRRWYQLNEVYFPDRPMTSEMFGLKERDLPAVYLLDQKGNLAAAPKTLSGLESVVAPFLAKETAASSKATAPQN